MLAPRPDRPPALAPRPAPIWAVLTVTTMGSLGTGGVTNGIFFLAKSALGFRTLENAALGVVMGLTYIAGAMGVGPAVRALAARSDRVSTRAVTIALHAALALLAVFPLAASSLSGGPKAWHLFVMCALYMPLSGALWPIVESYLSGGRRGGVLRSVIGRFNIVWSASVALSFWLMAPLVEHQPFGVLALVGLVHLLTIPLAWRMGKEPGRHLAETHEPHPEIYARLLSAVRALLPTSYLVASAMGVYLPTALDRVGVALAWQTPLVSAWLIARVAVFALMERHHNWHGRWWPVTLATTLLMAGFALAVVTPAVATGTPGAVLLACALFAFGAGMAGIYCAALYYAMEVGAAEVDAGGVHEALIGIGYTVGPAATLGVAWAVRTGVVPEPWREPVLAGVVALLAAGAVGLSLRRGRVIGP